MQRFLRLAFCSILGLATDIVLSQERPLCTNITWEIKQHRGVLKSFGELELCPQLSNSTQRIYRVLIKPTWGDTFIFRIQNTSEGAILISKRRKWPDLEQNEFTLTPLEFQELETLVNKAEFERMGWHDPDMGCDGEYWTLEVSRPGLYHVARRWSPTEETPQKPVTQNFIKVFQWLATRANAIEKVTNRDTPILK